MFVNIFTMSFFILGGRLNPFQVKVPLYIPLKNQKTPGFLIFSGGYRKETLALNGLIKQSTLF